MINPEDIELDDMPGEFRAVAELIGIDSAMALVAGFSGCQIYIPKLDTMARKLIHRRMYDDYQAWGNYKRVALKYGLSESRTRHIIKVEQLRMKKNEETQGMLF